MQIGSKRYIRENNDIETVFFGPAYMLEIINAQWISFIPTQASTFGQPLTIPTGLPQPLIRIPVPFIFMDDMNIFQTMANLSNVKRLRIQQRYTTKSANLYCAGICVYYMDGSVGTLGQWDGSLTVESKTIYDATLDRPLESLTFRYGSGYETEKYIIDIIANSSPNTGINQKEKKDKSGRDFYWLASKQQVSV